MTSRRGGRRAQRCGDLSRYAESIKVPIGPGGSRVAVRDGDRVRYLEPRNVERILRQLGGSAEVIVVPWSVPEVPLEWFDSRPVSVPAWSATLSLDTLNGRKGRNQLVDYCGWDRLNLLYAVHHVARHPNDKVAPEQGALAVVALAAAESRKTDFVTKVASLKSALSAASAVRDQIDDAAAAELRAVIGDLGGDLSDPRRLQRAVTRNLHRDTAVRERLADAISLDHAGRCSFALAVASARAPRVASEAGKIGLSGVMAAGIAYVAPGSGPVLTAGLTGILGASVVRKASRAAQSAADHHAGHRISDSTQAAHQAREELANLGPSQVLAETVLELPDLYRAAREQGDGPVTAAVATAAGPVGRTADGLGDLRDLLSGGDAGDGFRARDGRRFKTPPTMLAVGAAAAGALDHVAGIALDAAEAAGHDVIDNAGLPGAAVLLDLGARAGVALTDPAKGMRRDARWARGIVEREHRAASIMSEETSDLWAAARAARLAAAAADTDATADGAVA